MQWESPATTARNPPGGGLQCSPGTDERKGPHVSGGLELHKRQPVVNRSITRWADGAGYDAGLRSAEVGRVMMPAEQASQFVERLTLRPIAAGPNVVLFLEWERVQVTIPITPG